MARAQGVSPATVQRIWDAHGLQPHRVKTFKLSKDPRFTEKLTDVVGLYLNPPDKAHDYKRNGTTTLFAALDFLQGKVFGTCLPRHRHQEFLHFLRQLDREFSRDLDLHLILDNYGTHTHPQVKAWLEKHPRFRLHFTPTGASWLNLVERWFREITEKRIRRGVFLSVKHLIAAIEGVPPGPQRESPALHLDSVRRVPSSTKSTNVEPF
ncbi:MAG: IS630 family transposase [Dehalococcoidia bacterium]|nr:IS630 family transposase [Dehalococcoidia bacterium]